jgi:hypothetical protein
MTNLHPVEHGGDCPDAHACRIQRRWLTAYACAAEQNSVAASVNATGMAVEKSLLMVKPPVDVGPENGALRAEPKCCGVDGGKRKPLLLKDIPNNC